MIASSTPPADRIDSLIDVLPTALWVGLIAFIVLYLGRDLMRSLGKRISKLNVAGVSAEFAEAFDSAAKASFTKVPSTQQRGAEARTARNADIIPGFRVLWVDDQPQNNTNEVRLLETSGILIDQATTTDEAIDRLRKEAYDLVISDIARPDSTGLDMLEEVRRLRLPTPVVFYVTRLDPDLPLPVGAFGIANRVDALVHLVLDVVERRRLA